MAAKIPIPEPESPGPWTPAILVLGTALRFTGLDTHSLWLDECMTWAIATADAPMDLLARDLSPPLAYLAFRAWVTLVGDSAPALRALPALVSSVSLLLLALAGRQMRPPAASRAMLLLVAVNPFTIWYAQEVRSYFAVELGATVLLLAWLRHERGLRGAGFLAAAGAAIAAGAGYTALLLPLTLAAAVLLRGRGARPVFGFATALVAGVSLWAPWWLLVIPDQLATGWGLGAPPGPAELADAVVRGTFHGGAGLLPWQRFAVWTGVASWSAMLVDAGWRAWARRSRTGGATIFSIGAAAIALAGACSFFVPVSGARYLLGPHRWLAAGVGLLATGTWRRLLVAVVVAAALVNVLGSRRANGKDGFREAFADLRAAFRPAEKILCLTGIVEAFRDAPARYYLRDDPALCSALVDIDQVRAAPPGTVVHVVFREAPYSWPAWESLQAAGRIVAEGPMRNRVRYARFVRS